MKKRIISKIMVLSAILGLGGCATSEPMQSVNNDQQPILSATEAQSMIQVSVRTLPPAAEHEQIVAAID